MGKCPQVFTIYVKCVNNKQYELTEYNLFVREQCEILKKNKHILGSGNKFIYIIKLWNKKKENACIEKTVARNITANAVVVHKVESEDRIRCIGERLVQKEER